MEYRQLGRTGVQVSPLCLGCMMFGRRAGEQDSIAMVHRALDAGINFLDTANVYGTGISEEVTGKALADGNRRDRVVLATKVHGKMGEGPNDQGNHRLHIVRQCEASLRRLRTDRIDLYQIHRPMSSIPVDETLRALDDLIRQGKVLYIGTSTYAAWQLCEALWIAKELGLNRFVCEQPPYNILDRRIERELLPFCQTYGVAVIPWSPLAGGILTGKYGRDRAAPEGTRYAGVDPTTMQNRMAPAVFDVIEALTPMAEGKGCTLSQFSLAWCMSRPGVTSPIIGPRTMEQLEDNLGALRVEITDDDRRQVDQLVAPGTNVSKFYEADFGPHPYR